MLCETTHTLAEGDMQVHDLGVCVWLCLSMRMPLLFPCHPHVLPFLLVNAGNRVPIRHTSVVHVSPVKAMLHGNMSKFVVFFCSVHFVCTLCTQNVSSIMLCGAYTSCEADVVWDAGALMHPPCDVGITYRLHAM